MTDVKVSNQVELVLRLSPEEVALLRAALRFLRSTLGRDEADEIAGIHALLERLEDGKGQKPPG